MTKKPLSGIAPIKKAAKAPPYKPSPHGKGCDTRIPSSKKAAHPPCESICSPSTVIPSAAEGSLLHCRHMHTCALTQTTPWCFLSRLSFTHGLPVCRKDPSTSALMTRKKDGSSHIVFHTAFPIQPLPLRGTSFHRKEGMSTRAPSLGRGC